MKKLRITNYPPTTLTQNMSPRMMKQRPPKKSWSTCWNNIGRTNEALCRETPSFLSSTESSRQGSEPLLPSERDPRVTRDHPRRTPLEANSRSFTGTLASFIKQFAFEIVQTISRYENKKYFLLFSVVIYSANGTRFDRGTVRIICHNKTKEEWMIFLATNVKYILIQHVPFFFLIFNYTPFPRIDSIYYIFCKIWKNMECNCHKRVYTSF